jgi:hypothetical protein
MATGTPEMQAVLERLKKLEAQNKRLKRVVATIALSVGALVIMAQTKGSPVVVSARKFTLLDANGKTKAELGLSEDNAHLWLYDGQPKDASVALTAAGLSLAGEDGSSRVVLQRTRDGAVLNLYNVNGKSQVHVGVAPETSDGAPTAGG